MKKYLLLVSILMSIQGNLLAQNTDFKRFINAIEEEETLITNLAKVYIKVPAVENLKDLSSLEIRGYTRDKQYYGIMVAFINEMKCEEGYFVSLDPTGMMIDFAKTIDLCEIDLNAQTYEASDGQLDGRIIEIMKESETVLDLSDTSATLDNADTDFRVYYEYFEIQSDGFLNALSAPTEFIDEREHLFASMQLLKEEDLVEFNRNELQEIKNEILAAYGQIFDSKSVQEFYDQVEWYRPVGEISDRLTDIEKRNIALIDQLILR